MRAVLHHRYGGPELLELGERPCPSPGPEQVLVEVHAASINAADVRLMRADPWLARLENGLLCPRKWPVLGSDFAGRIAAVGENVTGWQIGDPVFGDAGRDGRGSFADYVAVRASSLAAIPAGLSFVEAAALPLAGITALQAIRDAAQLDPRPRSPTRKSDKRVGEGRTMKRLPDQAAHPSRTNTVFGDATGRSPAKQVLVFGAGGGVGGFVVQIAKAYGAHVTAVCGPASVAHVEALGADVVIDYTREDFVDRGARYDAITAVNGHRRPRDYRRCLKPGGRLVVVGGSNRQIFEGLLLAPLLVRGQGRRGRTLIVDEARQAEDLAELRALVERGALRAVVERVFALEQFVEAIRYFEAGHTRGKVVLAIQPPLAPPVGGAGTATI